MNYHADHYGLHWDGPVGWLVQGRKGSNFVGLRERCPFSVQSGMCNHMIPTAAPVPDRLHWDYWLKIYSDPLTQAMLPIPHDAGQNIFYVEDPYDDLALYLATLSRLSSPLKPIIRPAWQTKIKQLEQELTSSNIQPLVLVQIDTKSQELVDTVGRLSSYSPRTVVMVGASDVVVSAPIQRIQTQIRNYNLQDLMTLPMENIGAATLRRFSRREQLDAPWESRQDRRNRHIQERS